MPEHHGLRPGRGDKQSTLVHLISGFQVEHDGERLQFPSAACRLIAYLALQEQPVSRSFVAGVLWPDSTEARAQGSLRSTLWRVRRVHDSIVSAAQTCLSLAPEVEVDTMKVVALARQLSGGEAPVDVGEVPLTRFSAELLPDWYDDWVAFERERLRLTSLRALEGMAEWYTLNGAFGRAGEAAVCAIRLEPLRESAHRALIRAHIAEGNYSEALREYRLYRDLLMTEMGLDPSDQMTDLLRDIGVTTQQLAV